jgi:hypothetical protein
MTLTAAQILLIKADLAKAVTDTKAPGDASTAALAATLATATTEAAALVPTPVQAVPSAPVITLKGSTLSFTTPAANPAVAGFDVYIGGVKAVSSNWQVGLPTFIDLSSAPSSTAWLGTLPIPAPGASESVTVTAYNSQGESARSGAVTYTTPAPPPPPPPPPVTGLVLLGSYRDPQGSWANVTAFGAETGCKVSVRTEYVTIGASSTWMGDLNYLLGLWKGSPYKMCLGVPLVPSAYPAVFAPAESLVPLHEQMVAAIKASGFPIQAIRPNWELNIGTTSDFKTDVAGGIAAWKAIVPIYREAGFLVEINTVPQGYWDVISLVEEPLLDYFDIVSCDPYDQSYATPIPNNQPAQSEAVWQTIAGGVDGLNALATFARANGKAFALAEWGVGIKSGGYGLGDDPTYIANIAGFITANLDLFTKPGGYVSYFDDFPSGWDTILADSPNSLAEFKKLFPALAG